VPGSFCWPDSTSCVTYGRLYTQEAAIKACSMMGGSWRLPSQEEWQALAKSYGGVYDNSNDEGKSAFIALTEDGNGGFNATAGGNRSGEGKFERLGAHGFYWTSTRYDSAEAWFYNFAMEAGLLNRHTGDKNMAISVRCIKE